MPLSFQLTVSEARVLGTLMEKARTVPDSYPLTLNSLLLGCNQRTSRDPLLNLSDTDIARALDRLAALNLVRENGGGRAARYEHNFQRGVGVPEQSAVLLGILMLRGPQTAGELRLNAERWYRFADISSVEAFLEELQDRPEDKGGALVTKLPRAPGAREQRWAHLLSGQIDLTMIGPEISLASSSKGMPSAADLQARVDALETELAQLKLTVQGLCAELGVAPVVSGPD